MATIVQPYNPWREQLAAGILGPLINNVITRGQQRADNALNNKVAGDFLTAVRGANTPQIAIPSFMPMSTPQSGNGWENAFRQNTNPLADFDANTARLAMPLGNIQAQPRMSNADMQAELIRTLAGTRADPAAIRAIVDPYMQASNKENYISMLSDAKSWDDFMRTGIAANIDGAMSDSALGTASKYAEYRQPNYQFQNVNAGDRNIMLSMNPATGDITSALAMPLGINPADVMRDSTTRYVADTNAATSRYTTDVGAETTRRGQDLSAGVENRRLDLQEEAAKWTREHPELEKVLGADGNIYFANKYTGVITHGIDENGNPITDASVLKNIEIKQDASGNYIGINKATNVGTPITDQNGNQIQGKPPQNNDRTNAVLTEAALASLRADEKRLGEDISTLRRNLSLANNQAERDAIQAQIDTLQNKLDEVQAQLRANLPTLTAENATTPTPKPSEPSPTSDDARRAMPLGNIQPSTTPQVRQSASGAFTPSTGSPVAARMQGQSGTTNISNKRTLIEHMNTRIDDIPAPVSTDIVNQTTPSDTQSQVDNLNGGPTSRDASLAMPLGNLQMTTPDIAPNVPNTVKTVAPPQTNNQDKSSQKTLPEAQRIRVAGLPSDFIFRTEEQEFMFPKSKILTWEKLQHQVDVMLTDNPTMTATQAAQFLYDSGYRVKLTEEQKRTLPSKGVK